MTRRATFAITFVLLFALTGCRKTTDDANYRYFLFPRAGNRLYHRFRRL